MYLWCAFKELYKKLMKIKSKHMITVINIIYLLKEGETNPFQSLLSY
jgi:hypothetical protein